MIVSSTSPPSPVSTLGIAERTTNTTVSTPAEARTAKATPTVSTATSAQ
ncbi:hypothetical protein ABT246_24015 [Streptomyces sp. NPDC001553]